MRSLTTRTATIIVAVLVALGGGAGTAFAYQSIDKARLEPGDTFKRSYPPITGMFPDFGVGAMSPEFCEDSSACDLIEVQIVSPESSEGMAYQTILRVSWPDDLEQNDIDVYFYNEQGEEVIHAATAENPESFGATYDDDGNIVSEGLYDLPSGTYYVAVLNFSGANSGYTVEGSMTEVPIEIFQGEAEDSAPAAAPAAPSEPARPRAAPPAPNAAPVVTESGPAPEQVDRPGADGPASELALARMSSSNQFAPDDGGLPVGSIVSTTLLAAIALAGATVVGLRIRRELG